MYNSTGNLQKRNFVNRIVTLCLLIVITPSVNGMKKDFNQLSLPLLIQDVNSIIFSDDSLLSLFNPKTKVKKANQTLKALHNVSRKLRQVVSSDSFTKAVINKLAGSRGQAIIASSLRTFSSRQYFKINDKIYKAIHKNNAVLNEADLLNPLFDINYCPKTRTKRKPLLFCSLNPNKLQALLDHNADVNMTYKGKTILQVCVEQKNELPVSVILQYSPRLKCLLSAFKSKNSTIVQRILKESIDEKEIQETFMYLLSTSDKPNLTLLLTKKQLDPSPFMVPAIKILLRSIHSAERLHKSVKYKIIKLLCKHKGWNKEAYELAKNLPRDYFEIVSLLEKNNPQKEDFVIC